ncbi:MAG: CpsD/CapB family tyrosine-protein kinase [Candidatus Omnitrophota bacterium]
MFTKYIAKEKDESQIDSRIVAYYDAGSTIVEQYRSIRTYINSLKGENLARSIVISSANRFEGKTITSINLAIVMAEERGKRVVLVNADFRFPAVEKLLNISDSSGLSEYLQDKITLDEALSKADIKGVTVLPSGRLPLKPAELLAGQKMKDLIEALEKRFDYVLIDTPAIIPVADVRILGSLVDGVILVVQASRTRREVVLRVQEQLNSLKARLLGVVLSNVEYHIPEYIHRHL